ncbi:MAG: ABC transporter ATP-binding protein [Oscillospiraceae bacterium]|nr:ABC transporter ATP-binding protein [Oscillospiraceae bacterium]
MSKTYDGRVFALHDLSLDVAQGEVFGFLGPNGAGKTTSVKLLTGLLRPSEGSCSVLGLAPALRPGDVHRLCGVVTESAKMYKQMTGMENLLFFAQVAGLKTEDGRVRSEELLKRLDLWEARDKKLQAYSTGMAQRLSLARALVHRPKLLFLDEPTSGLDPESAQTVNEMIAAMAHDEGVTVFLCTHQLRYAQDICTTYGILNRGALLACGDLETLSRNAEIRMKAAVRLREGEEPQGFERGGDGWWRTDILREEEMPPLLKSVVAAGHSLYEARIVKPTLEDVYFRYLSLGGEAVSP